MRETLLDCAPGAFWSDGPRSAAARPKLTSLSEERILAWADGHRRRTGSLPKASSGVVADAPWETWSAINAALGGGSRGLPGGDSLARLLRRTGRIGERRGRPPRLDRQDLARCLLALGLSRAEIGRRMGISRQAAWQLLKRIVPEEALS